MIQEVPCVNQKIIKSKYNQTDTKAYILNDFI